ETVHFCFWFAGRQLENKQCPVATTTDMQTRKLTRQRLSSRLETYFATRNFFNLIFCTRSLFKAVDWGNVRIMDPSNEELLMLNCTRRFRHERLSAHDVQDHVSDAKRTDLIVRKKPQIYSPFCILKAV